MHLLATSSAALDDLVEPIDLGQPPGDLVILSFADSDLAGIAAAWTMERDALPSVRLAHLRDLRHPMSVDLWIERVGQNAKVILVRLLGGLDWWRYGIERLSVLARERGIALAVLPGEDRDDPRLAAASTLSQDELDILLAFFREGGRETLRALRRRWAHRPVHDIELREPQPVPRLAGYLPGEGAVDIERLIASLKAGHPVVPIVFYRALLLADDTAPVDALCAALAARGLAPAALFVTSLKDREAGAFLRQALDRLKPSLIVTMTAFAAGGTDEPAPLDAPGVPVFQVVSAITKRAAWRDSARGLGAADLAMHVVLPELDGRVLAGVIAFKDALPIQAGLAFSAFASRPEPDRVAMVADRIAAHILLQALPASERMVAILMPDYPGAPGRTGYAVGLDVPASVIALLDDLSAAGYAVSGAPKTPREPLDALSPGADDATLAIEEYERLLATRVPSAAIARLREAWGEPADDADVHDGAFRFRVKNFGKLLVALPPDRGRSAQRRADYHDALLPPRHALVAFGLWLQHVAKVDALLHMGAHGTLEWLPGKAIALTAECFPEIVTGALPVIYPFIVNNPGEAWRRIAAWLCDLKDLAVKDGLHIYGRAPASDEPARQASATAERAALI